jgi:hypothetical protein
MFRRRVREPEVIERVPWLAPWDYQHRPPFCVYALVPHTGVVVEKTLIEDLDEAMRWFVRFYVGPLANTDAMVLDGDLKILVVYGTASGIPHWGGTAAGFAKLAEHYDPMDVAIWEGQAAPKEMPHEC